MLMMIFPHEYSNEEVARAWDYYLPYTTHDSSLSPGVHAVVACRLGKLDEAWQFWQQSCAIDLDIEAGGAREGMHIANCGLIWQMAVLGFAGVRTALQSAQLTLSPTLPPAWSRLRFPLMWKGSPLHIDVTAAGVEIRNRSAAALDVTVSGTTQSIAPGRSATWRRS
jgi:kojibiose phosphorylase